MHVVIIIVIVVVVEAVAVDKCYDGRDPWIYHLKQSKYLHHTPVETLF